MRLLTTNGLKWLSKDIKRRTRVTMRFANEACLLRLVSAVLSKISKTESSYWGASPTQNDSAPRDRVHDILGMKTGGPNSWPPYTRQIMISGISAENPSLLSRQRMCSCYVEQYAQRYSATAK